MNAADVAGEVLKALRCAWLIADEIAEVGGISPQTARLWAKSWTELGIVEARGREGPIRGLRPTEYTLSAAFVGPAA